MRRDGPHTIRIRMITMLLEVVSPRPIVFRQLGKMVGLNPWILPSDRRWDRHARMYYQNLPKEPALKLPGPPIS